MFLLLLVVGQGLQPLEDISVKVQTLHVCLYVCPMHVFADYSGRLPQGTREVCPREESKKIR